MYGFKEIESPALAGLLSSGESVRLIDVRSPAEVQRGGIADAHSIPLHLLPLKVAEVERDQPIVFYCHSGVRSAQACSFLSARGHENVFNLRGGLLAWLHHGMPLGPVLASEQQKLPTESVKA